MEGVEGVEGVGQATEGEVASEPIYDVLGGHERAGPVGSGTCPEVTHVRHTALGAAASASQKVVGSLGLQNTRATGGMIDAVTRRQTHYSSLKPPIVNLTVLFYSQNTTSIVSSKSIPDEATLRGDYLDRMWSRTTLQ